MIYPNFVCHFIDNKAHTEKSEPKLVKFNPATESPLASVAVGLKATKNKAVESAWKSADSWKNTSVIDRGKIIRQMAQLLFEQKNEIAQIVSLETGKSTRDARGEIQAAIELGYFMAGEGQRFYGQTTSSATPNRFAYTIRQPVGLCALVTSFNTPIANMACKVFPSVLCGNTAILKPSEHAPYSAFVFGEILAKAGLPPGVLSIIQGGPETGKLLVEDRLVDLISFTGSVETGRAIAEKAGKRLTRICLELGGKNPLIVCDDANIENAIQSAISSAFSNAGQRCASASRLIIFEDIYKKFRGMLIDKTRRLSLGTSDDNDLGPVISQKQLDAISKSVNVALQKGAICLTGGARLNIPGYYFKPTILENVHQDSRMSNDEIFGPVTCLYKVRNLKEAIDLANNTNYGLTGAIHTSNIHRVQEFTNGYKAGVVSVNGPTFGSEPHMPFGGLKNSGNGWREPGTQVLDTYSEWKTVYVKHDPSLV